MEIQRKKLPFAIVLPLWWLIQGCNHDAEVKTVKAKEPIKEEIPFEEEPSETIHVQGVVFNYVTIYRRHGMDPSSVRGSYWGTLNDTLFAIPAVDLDDSCMLGYPVLCWSDTIVGRTFEYQNNGKNRCPGRGHGLRERFSLRVLAYQRTGDEQLFTIRHTLLVNRHSPGVKNDPRWPDLLRRPEKTFVISSKAGVFGVYDNALSVDWFKF